MFPACNLCGKFIDGTMGTSYPILCTDCWLKIAKRRQAEEPAEEVKMSQQLEIVHNLEIIIKMITDIRERLDSIEYLLANEEIKSVDK